MPLQDMFKNERVLQCFHDISWWLVWCFKKPTLRRYSALCICQSIHNSNQFEITICESISMGFLGPPILKKKNQNWIYEAINWQWQNDKHLEANFTFSFSRFLSFQLCKQMVHRAICSVSLLWTFFTHKRKRSIVFIKPEECVHFHSSCLPQRQAEDNRVFSSGGM